MHRKIIDRDSSQDQQVDMTTCRPLVLKWRRQSGRPGIGQHMMNISDNRHLRALKLPWITLLSNSIPASIYLFSMFTSSRILLLVDGHEQHTTRMTITRNPQIENSTPSMTI
ncbi:hypothetical protein EVAR_62327_1 [Eumeta japonica]|uniref:Uncharacterized protein n=1 Tax=Eumeta variegata TaxID=151549 RepID=A0A4C1Z8P4_EUMVA|nr:hypothetical protein EVAR_62327_1 [Eumeta japonica]